MASWRGPRSPHVKEDKGLAGESFPKTEARICKKEVEAARLSRMSSHFHLTRGRPARSCSTMLRFSSSRLLPKEKTAMINTRVARSIYKYPRIYFN